MTNVEDNTVNHHKRKKDKIGDLEKYVLVKVQINVQVLAVQSLKDTSADGVTSQNLGSVAPT